MTDKEILVALSDMLDPMKKDISEMKKDISEMKIDISGGKKEISGMKVDIAGLKEDVSDLKEEMSEVKERLKRVELRQENEIVHRLQTIESCYTSTYDRYRQSVEGYEELRQDMDVVKKVVAEHSAKLQMIPTLPILRCKKKKNVS